MTKLSDTFAGKAAAFLLMTTTALATGCAGYGGGYTGGYNNGYGGQQGNQNYPAQTTQPQQQQITVTGSPCGNQNISYFPMANKAFQQCGATGVELGASPNGFIVTKTFNLQNSREASAFSKAYDRADLQDQRQNDRAIRNAQRQQRQADQDPYGLRQTRRNVNDINSTINSGANTLRSIERGAKAFKNLFGN